MTWYLAFFLSLEITHVRSVWSPREIVEGVATSDGFVTVAEAQEQEQQRKMMQREVSIGANGAIPPIPVMRRQQQVFDKQSLANKGFKVQSEHSNTQKLTQEIK